MGELLVALFTLFPAKYSIGAIVVTIAFFTIKGLAGGKNRDVRRVMPVRFWVWRFFTGQHLDGYRRTNGTFRYRGTKALGGIVRASKWQYRAGWERLTFRMGWLTAVIVIPLGLLLWNTATKVVMITGIVAFIGYYIYRLGRYIVLFYHYKKWVKPLHYAIHGQIGIRRDTRATDYISLPANFRTDPDTEGRIDLPIDYSGNDSQSVKALERTIGGKLGMSDIEVYLHMKSDTPHVTFKRAPAPPERVMYAEVKDVIAKAKDDAPFLGYGPRGVVVNVQLDDESPHVLVSAGTGAGKSALLRLIAAQGLSKGAGLVICDIKRVSHKWAKGLPHVVYCRTAEEIHNALIAADQEVERRYSIIDSVENEDDADVGPRLFILLEEMNATIRKLESYWRKIRRGTDPKVSPAVEAIGNILFMGRAAKVHVIAVAQMATARALGGPEARENFATRILARFTINAWKMLVPEVWPAPKSSRHSGRVHVVIAGEAIETQITFVTVEEARLLAMSAIPPQRVETSIHAAETIEIEEKVTLAKACSLEWIPVKYETAKKARQREQDFPSGEKSKNGLVYTRQELEEWYRNRDHVVSEMVE